MDAHAATSSRRLLTVARWLVPACACAAGVYIAATLPPAAARLHGTLPALDIMGGYHIHTRRSDGSGTVDDIAAAAARAGLSFVIVTDHGDALRPPDPPAYKSGVLVIDAVEIGTTGGHIVALGFKAPAPYPLGGAPRDVLEDIHRLGGIAIVAHPDSAATGLRYRGPDTGFDGIEWLNIDSEWRDRSAATLLRGAADYLIRRPESIGSLLVTPVRTLARWDALERARPVFGMAALDVHARIGWRAGEEPRTGRGINQPTYEAMFRTLAQVVALDAPLSGDAAADAGRVLAAVATGHSYSIVRAQADPASLEFTADQDDTVARMGDRLPRTEPTTLHAVVRPDAASRVVLLRDGKAIAEGRGVVTHVATVAGVYRVEAWLPNARIPWIVSNPITLGLPLAPPPAAAAPLHEIQTVALDGAGWRLEREPSSTASLEAKAGGLHFDVRLGGGRPNGQYAAVATDLSVESAVHGVQFTVRADHDLRLSVQIRRARDGRRWIRSIHAGSVARSVVVPFSEFEPAERSDSGFPAAADVSSLLFVVDTTNTAPGSAAVIWLSDVGLGR